jgi:hypothetical protein
VEEQITEQKFNIINLIESGPCEGCPRDSQEPNPGKGGSRTMDIVKTLEELRKAYPDLCLQLETEVKTKTEKDLKEGLEKEWLAKCNELAAGIEKKIQESEEYKNYVKGMDAHKSVILEIARVVRPYMTEMGEEDDDDPQVEDLKKQLEQSKQDNADLKKKQEKDQAAADEKKKAKDKVSEMTAGKEHGDLIAERLQDCKTVAEVETRFPAEVAYIKRVRGEKATEEEKGKGKVIDENKETKPEEKEKSLEEQRKDWSAEQIRQRELAGLEV